MAGVLGISIGTRTVGIAITQHDKLIDWRVKTFTTRWSTEKRDAILKMLKEQICKYSITEIVLKVPSNIQALPNLVELVRSLTKMATMVCVSIRTYTVEDLKLRYTSERGGKEIVFSAIGHKYPELYHEYKKVKSNRKAYYAKVFEAIACTQYGTGL